MIVLNGEPFLRYNLKSLYPFAHQIIVVEGAAIGAKNIATTDGHSRDKTLEILRNFKKEKDPENKLVIVTAEDEGYANGFWPGEKDEQSQAYAKRTTGNYLWQIDVDEFYRTEDMRKILHMLKEAPEITAVTFKQITFWGGFDYITDGWYLKRGNTYCHRLFKWDKNYEYKTHRPPTVCNTKGKDLRKIKWCSDLQTAKENIFLYHYSLVFPKQVQEKSDYYKNAKWVRRYKAVKWEKETFRNLKHPYRIHNIYTYPSWLERATIQHPEQIENMRADIQNKTLSIDMRQTDDIEKLLSSRKYILGRFLLKFFGKIYCLYYFMVLPFINFIKRHFPFLKKLLHLFRKYRQDIYEYFYSK